MLGIAAMLASCSQDSLDTAQGGSTAVITAIVDNGISTRASTYETDDVTIDRCLLEVYDQEGNLVGAQHSAQADGSSGTFSFTVSGLDFDQKYDFVFWADNSEAAAYEGNLKNRRLADGADLSEALAFQGKISGAAPVDAKSVNLTHAVAKVTLSTTGELPAGGKVGVSLTDVTDTWNVLTGEATGEAASSYEYSVAKALTGADGSDEVTTFYVPAPTDGSLNTVEISYVPAGMNTVGNISKDNVPLKADYRTLFKGDIAKLYSGETSNMTATLTEGWSGGENVDMPTTNVVETTAIGQITEEAIRTVAQVWQGSVVVKGPISEADLKTIAAITDLPLKLDLSGAELSDGSGTPMTTFPAVFNNSGGTTNKSRIAEIILPEGITTLPVNCFSANTSLEKITLPSSLKEIQNHAFSGTTALASISLPEGLESIGFEVFRGSALTGELVIPSTLTYIERDAFMDTKISSCVWNSGCNFDDGNSPFTNCSFDSFTFNNMGEINTLFFAGCSLIDKLIVNIETPPTINTNYGSTFGNTTINHIYVPEGSVDAYKAATVWKNYADIIEAIPTSGE